MKRKLHILSIIFSIFIVMLFCSTVKVEAKTETETKGNNKIDVR